jgi:hypothetical protein
MIENMTFEQAVDYVLKSKMTAYAFLPKKKGEVVRGCELFILVCCEEYETEPEEYPEYLLENTGGIYNDSCGYEDSYWPEDIPDGAKNLLYFKSFEKSVDPGYEVQVTLKQLNGIPLDVARFDADCEVCEKSILETGRLSLCGKCSSKKIESYVLN